MPDIAREEFNRAVLALKREIDWRATETVNLFMAVIALMIEKKIATAAEIADCACEFRSAIQEPDPKALAMIDSVIESLQMQTHRRPNLRLVRNEEVPRPTSSDRPNGDEQPR